jgi:Protein of unknown function (DUF3617)
MIARAKACANRSGGKMRKSRVCVTLVCCFFAMASCAWGQGTRKPGLFEVTTTMTFQQSPMPPGMQAPPGSPFSGAPRSSQVCVTQAMIDKYGGPAPTPGRGDCQVTNISMSPTGMTANIACTGQMAGSGNVNTTWSEGGTSQTKVHFTGTMQMGPRSAPVEWTMQANATYKGPDCGSVKPLESK